MLEIKFYVEYMSLMSLLDENCGFGRGSDNTPPPCALFAGGKVGQKKSGPKVVRQNFRKMNIFLVILASGQVGI